LITASIISITMSGLDSHFGALWMIRFPQWSVGRVSTDRASFLQSHPKEGYNHRVNDDFGLEDTRTHEIHFHCHSCPALQDPYIILSSESRHFTSTQAGTVPFIGVIRLRYSNLQFSTQLTLTSSSSPLVTDTEPILLRLHWIIGPDLVKYVVFH
jgi:hypothetical protein